jgi:hypothetical protein
MCVGLHAKGPFFLSDFNETFNSIGRFFKNHQSTNFVKIRPAGAEVFYADGRTDGEMRT